MIRTAIASLLLLSTMMVIGCDSTETDDHGDSAADTSSAAAVDSTPSSQALSTSAPSGTPMMVYKVEQAEEGEKGAFGCGDKLVADTAYVQSGEDALEVALAALFSPDHAGPDNPAATGSIALKRISVDGSIIRVYLTGEFAIAGICDHERIVRQITETATQVQGLDSAEIFVDDQTLEEYLSLG